MKKLKEFDNWNEKKKGLNQREDQPFYHEREIWWCSMGINIGVEADGKGEEFSRPVIVIKGFNKRSFLGLSLTGARKEGKFYFYLGQIEDREASANLSQIKLFDTKRLVRKMITLDETTFNKLTEKIKDSLFN